MNLALFLLLVECSNACVPTIPDIELPNVSTTTGTGKLSLRIKRMLLLKKSATYGLSKFWLFTMNVEWTYNPQPSLGFWQVDYHIVL